MPRFAVLALAFLLGALPALPAAARDAAALSATDGWVRQTPPGRAVAAGYVSLRNPSAQDVVFVDARASGAERVEFHTHDHEDGMMRMRRLDSVTIPAGRALDFAPGGHHLMLFGIDATRAGTIVDLTLVAEDGSRLDLALPVRRTAPGSEP